MRRPRTVSRKPSTTRQRKTENQKRKTASNAAHRATSSVAHLQEQLERQARELEDAREERAAISEVLRVISSSPGYLQPVFQAMLENAIRLCQAKFGAMFLYDGETFRTAALHGVSPAYAETRRGALVVRDLHPNVPLARVAQTNEVIHIADATLDQSYVEPDPRMVELVDLAGARSLITVPMLKESRLIGAINIYRQEVRPFSDKQIELVQNFAAQAVIAIENARLLNELRESNADLAEALEQQTATSEVLQVISNSPGDLQPVFEAMLEKAVRICDTKFGNIYRWDGEALQLVASHNTPPAFAEFRRRTPYRDPSSQSGVGRMLATKTAVQVADVPASKAYIEHRLPEAVAAVEMGGVRTFVAVPMLKDRELIGALMLFRQEVRPFTDKQIELVQNFAAQAVIAIENARLFQRIARKNRGGGEA